MKNDFQIQKIRIQQKTQKIRIQQKIVTTYVQTQALCPFYLVPVLSSFIAQEAFMWRGIPWQLPCSEIRQGHITFRKSLSQNQRLWSSGIPKLRSYTVWCLAAVQTDRQTDRHMPTSHIIALLFLTTTVTPNQLSWSMFAGFHSFRVENHSGTSERVQYTLWKRHTH